MAQQEIVLQFSNSRELVPIKYEHRRGVRHSLRLRGGQLHHLMVLDLAPRTSQVIADLERQKNRLHPEPAIDPRQSFPRPQTTFFLNEIISLEDRSKIIKLRQDLMQKKLKI